VQAVESNTGSNVQTSIRQSRKREANILYVNDGCCCRWMIVAVGLTVFLALCLWLFIAIARLSKCMLTLWV